MSYPYPQDRHLDRKEKGEQPYKDAKESLTRNQAGDGDGVQTEGQERPRTTSLSQGGGDVPEDVVDSMRRAGEGGEVDDEPAQR